MMMVPMLISYSSVSLFLWDSSVVAYFFMMMKTFSTGSEWTYLCCVVLMRSSWIFWSEMLPYEPKSYVMMSNMVPSRTPVS